MYVCMYACMYVCMYADLCIPVCICIEHRRSHLRLQVLKLMYVCMYVLQSVTSLAKQLMDENDSIIRQKSSHLRVLKANTGMRYVMYVCMYVCMCIYVEKGIRIPQ